MRARVTVKYQNRFDPYHCSEVHGIGFLIDDEGKLLQVVEDGPLDDLSFALRQLANWVDSKLPKVVAPEPPAELELVDP